MVICIFLVKSTAVVKDFENVELGDLGKKPAKIPRRTIYFASGETMEEYSTDEEEEEEPQQKNISVESVSDIKSCFAIFCDFLYMKNIRHIVRYLL